MHLLKFCILSFISVHLTLSAAVIKGTVRSREDHKPVDPSCTVYFLNSRLGATTDQMGDYVINGVPIGRYIVRFSALTFITQIETVTVVDSNQTVICNIELQIPLIESTPAIEAYQHKLDSANSKNPILTFHLDCMVFRDGFVTIHSSMRNNSKEFSFHVLRICECLNPVEAIIKDSDGKTVPTNMMRIDCVGEKIYPDWYDQITVPEEQTIDYVPVKLEYYDFKQLPEGIYTIALKYKHHVPRQLCCHPYDADYRDKYKMTIQILLSSLRGEYVSSNTLTFDNKH